MVQCSFWIQITAAQAVLSLEHRIINYWELPLRRYGVSDTSFTQVHKPFVIIMTYVENKFKYKPIVSSSCNLLQAETRRNFLQDKQWLYNCYDVIWLWTWVDFELLRWTRTVISRLENCSSHHDLMRYHQRMWEPGSLHVLLCFKV